MSAMSDLDLMVREGSRTQDDFEARGIAPDETVYVGNDMLNDIGPAHKVGFRTALFAGDARSLRRRENDPVCAGVKPDFIVSHLQQVCSGITGIPPVPV